MASLLRDDFSLVDIEPAAVHERVQHHARKCNRAFIRDRRQICRLRLARINDGNSPPTDDRNLLVFNERGRVFVNAKADHLRISEHSRKQSAQTFALLKVLINYQRCSQAQPLSQFYEAAARELAAQPACYHRVAHRRSASACSADSRAALVSRDYSAQ